MRPAHPVHHQAQRLLVFRALSPVALVEAFLNRSRPWMEIQP